MVESHPCILAGMLCYPSFQCGFDFLPHAAPVGFLFRRQAASAFMEAFPHMFAGEIEHREQRGEVKMTSIFMF